MRRPRDREEQSAVSIEATRGGGEVEQAKHRADAKQELSVRETDGGPSTERRRRPSPPLARGGRGGRPTREEGREGDQREGNPEG